MKNQGLSEKIISLLIELNNNKINTIDSLYQSLGFPRPTLHRLLIDLINMKLVIKHQDTHFYSVTSACSRLSNGVTKDLEFIERASLIAKELTQRHEWPIAIATEEEGEMQVRFSSRPDARFSFIKSTVGKRFPIFGSALGEAWLAHRSERERILWLNKMPQAIIHKRMRQLKEDNISVYLDKIKVQGYALRYGRSGESSHLAVPVIKGKRILGVMGISVFATAIGEKIIPLYLDSMKSGAHKITSQI